MKIQKDTFTFRVHPELLEAYQQFCEQTGTSASADLRERMKEALKLHLDKLVA